MCVFNFFFLNDVKDNYLKSLSELFQMLTALQRKRHPPDFVLLRKISRDSLFIVLWQDEIRCFCFVLTSEYRYAFVLFQQVNILRSYLQ